MKHLVPLDKQSKKARREFHRAQRNLWHMNPVTRVRESRKVYSRSRSRQEMREFL